MFHYPTLNGVELPIDDASRINLNALHKSSKTGQGKDPSHWLRLKGTTELIEALKSELDHCPDQLYRSVQLEYRSEELEDERSKPELLVSVPGQYGGTFAHELLALSYAGWIKPSFQLKVNQIFLDYKRGQLTPPPKEIPPESKAAAARLKQSTRMQLLNKAIQLSKKEPNPSEAVNPVFYRLCAMVAPGQGPAIPSSPGNTVSILDPSDHPLVWQWCEAEHLFPPEPGDKTVMIQAKDLYARFSTWCEDSGVTTINMRAWGMAMATRFEKKKTNRVYYIFRDEV